MHKGQDAIRAALDLEIGAPAATPASVAAIYALARKALGDAPADWAPIDLAIARRFAGGAAAILEAAGRRVGAMPASEAYALAGLNPPSPATARLALAATVLDEVLEPDATRRSVAVLYALCIGAFPATERLVWQALNRAVRACWPGADEGFAVLEEVKTEAWSIYEQIVAELSRGRAAVTKAAMQQGSVG